jgi:hypothetical protein
MIKRLTDVSSIEDAERRIRELIGAHGEWLYARASHRSVSLQRSECDFRVSQGRLIFSCWSEQGALVWRIAGWEWTGAKLLLEASRRMGAESARLELIPRASVEAASAAIGETRRERCYTLARLACAVLQDVKIERAGLSAGARRGQPGRYARIMLRHLKRERIAVTGEVAKSDSHAVDALLSSTLTWFTRASERTRPPDIQKLWFLVEKECVEALTQRLALLRVELRRIIMVFQIDDDWQKLTPVRMPELEELLTEPPPKRFRYPARDSMSESAARIVSHAPEAIDVMRSRHGETLRFHGLSFARVRRLLDRENVWFGIEGARRRLLYGSTQKEWSKLLQDLQEHRSAETADPQHALYRASTEAWLESRLRRDVTRLDPGLRLAPIHAQFRPGHPGRGSRPIDLLALRRDGRLVVIELKVSEDREHVLQGADYWRRISTYNRQGHIARSRLFGTAEISDEPPLVYLVAPLLRFHRAFQTLARCIAPGIEMYRFDINEDWRTGVRVMRRMRVN